METMTLCDNALQLNRNVIFAEKKCKPTAQTFICIINVTILKMAKTHIFFKIIYLSHRFISFTQSDMQNVIS